jgi:hypothetical protein
VEPTAAPCCREPFAVVHRPQEDGCPHPVIGDTASDLSERGSAASDGVGAIGNLLGGVTG